MRFFSQNMIRRRVTVALAVATLLVIISGTFINYISTPTDENWFRDIPSNLLISKNFPAVLQSKKPYLGMRTGKAIVRDSLLVGDLILKMNDGQVSTIKDAEDIVSNFSNVAEIKFTVLRPSVNSILEMRSIKSNIPQDFLIRLSHFVYVSDVTSNGASDRAGMKVGDLIVSINEQTFSNALDADRILREGQIGKTITYDVLRGNEYITLHVMLAKFGIQNGLLLFMIGGLGMLLIGAFIWYSRPNLFVAQLIGMSFVAIGYFMSVLVIRRDADVTVFNVIRNSLIGFTFFIGPALMFHTFHYFPKERQELISRKWIARTYYILSGVSAVLTLLFNFPYAIIIPFPFALYISFHYRKLASPEYKELSKVIKRVSSSIGILSFVILILRYNEQDPIAVGVVGLMLLAIPLSFLYTIGRYHLLDMNLRIRRNIQYSIFSFFWTLVVVYVLVWSFFKISQIAMPNVDIVFTGASIELSDTPNTIGNSIPAEHVILIVVSFAAAFLFVQLRRFGQKFIDRKYFRTQYDYRKAAQEFGDVLATTHSVQQLAKDFVVKLAVLVQLKKAGVIFFRDETYCACVEVYGFNGEQWKEFCFAEEKNLIASVKQFQNEIRVDYLPTAIKQHFHTEGFHYIVPIHSKERLLGFIVVGEKRAETTFRQEDLSFLSSVAKQASVAIENAFLYEELAEKERLKHELDIARRIQLDSLPQTTPSISGLEISGTSLPAMEVGGDFFDYLTDKRLTVTIIIGDVSGKGTSAALYMSKVQGILRSLYGFQLSPGELFRKANSLLCKDLEKRSFITAMGAEFFPAQQALIVSRAGHLPLFYFDSIEQKVKKIIPKGLGLGLNDDGVFASELEEYQLHYHSGDIFLFATDGVTEARNENLAEFGEEHLQALLFKNASSTADGLKEIILTDLKLFAQNALQYDDQTIVIVKIK